MNKLLPFIILLPLSGVLCGCPVTQEQQVPVPAQQLSAGGTDYWIYVPSNYTPTREWPLVLTLHGTFGFDSASRQIDEWKRLAEDKGFIVVAPQCRSVQGIAPKIESLWYKDMQADEKAILTILDQVEAKYKIGTFQVDNKPWKSKTGRGSTLGLSTRKPAPAKPAASQPATTRPSAGRTARPAVMLTGFSAGGYPMYFTGLRNPERFGIIVGRACNSQMEMMDRLAPTEEARLLPIYIFWGRDDAGLNDMCWNAVAWLSNHHFTHLDWKQVPGGHQRHPEYAWQFWQKMLPAEMKPE